MDTFKDKQQLDSLCTSGVAPWEIWKKQNGHSKAVVVNEPLCVA